VEETIKIRDRSRALAEERQQLQARIAELEPWGDFELPDWARQGALRFWFYTVPLHKVALLASIDVPWRIVGRDHRFARVVVVAADPPVGMPGSPVMLDPRSLGTLRARLEEVEEELEQLDDRRIGLSRHARALRAALDQADDHAARERAGRSALEREQVFAVQGWAPKASVGAIRRYAADHRLAVTVERPGPRDAPPTLLDNPPALRGGEGLVAFYRTPGYRMWDPSQAVFLGFAVFFGMIVSDAAYGLVLGLGMLAAWKRLGRAGGGFRGLVLALVLSSIVYGVLVGSYFGLTPRPGSLLARARVLHADDQGLMMLISIGVGVAHLAVANLVTAWRRRRSPAALGSLGWTAVLLGGFWAVVSRAHPGQARLGLVAVGAGLVLVLLFSSPHPMSFAPRALLGRLLEGLKSLTEISKVFGDVLSYLRLFALGLAAIKLAEAFNGLAASSFALGGVGVLLGIVVLLVGHTINLAMGILGGVVHGLRLNVIEFFNWSLPEEGEPYRAFARKAV
jgi:V/A-type H+-transporting ATPase subunit I